MNDGSWVQPDIPWIEDFIYRSYESNK